MVKPMMRYSKSYITSSMLLCASVTTVFCISSLILSVDALRCHQCNSHLDEECNNLRLSTPRSLPDDQYLKECEGTFTEIPFCRKTVVKIDANEEHRIVRTCGWIPDKFQKSNKSLCYSADNEGYKQTICACYEDGCNAASGRYSTGDHLFSLIGTTIGTMLLAAYLGRTTN